MYVGLALLAFVKSDGYPVERCSIMHLVLFS